MKLIYFINNMIIIIANYDYYNISIGIVLILIIINLILSDMITLIANNSILNKLYVYLFGKRNKMLPPLPYKIKYKDYKVCDWILTLEKNSYINRLETGGIRYEVE